MHVRSMLLGLAFAAVTIIGAGAEPAAAPSTVGPTLTLWARAADDADWIAEYARSSTRRSGSAALVRTGSGHGDRVG